MSYDLTIRYDDVFSQYAQVGSLADFIGTLSYMRRGGELGFTFDDGTRYMEIDLEVVSEEGDNIEERGTQYRKINSVALHIPYQMLGDAPERDYFPTAHAIASYLGWKLFDLQRGEYLSPTSDGGSSDEGS